jgi:hypothetical protein
VSITPEQQAIANAVYDEALIVCGSDHIAAANFVQEAFVALEAAGQVWASTLIDAATQDGFRKRVKIRAKRAVVHIPSASGVDATMPARYARRSADGSVQMSFWLDLPLDALLELVDSMQAQGGVLLQRASRMKRGLDFALEHGVSTAREGFAAAGVEIDEDIV